MTVSLTRRHHRRRAVRQARRDALAGAGHQRRRLDRRGAVELRRQQPLHAAAADRLRPDPLHGGVGATSIGSGGRHTGSIDDPRGIYGEIVLSSNGSPSYSPTRPELRAAEPARARTDRSPSTTGTRPERRDRTDRRDRADGARPAPTGTQGRRPDGTSGATGPTPSGPPPLRAHGAVTRSDSLRPPMNGRARTDRRDRHRLRRSRHARRASPISAARSTASTSTRPRSSCCARGEVPIYEPGLAELIARNRERMHFSTTLDEAVAHARLLFVCVGTPPTYAGDADLSAVHRGRRGDAGLRASTRW